MISDADRDVIIAFAKDAVPNEMCGLLFKQGGFYLAKNVSPTPKRSFEIAHSEYLHAMASYGSEPWAIVHSHPRTGPWPSLSDMRLMKALTEVDSHLAMVIVGLERYTEPEMSVYVRTGECWWKDEFAVQTVRAT